MKEKQDLRHKMLRLRSELDTEHRATASAQINEELRESFPKEARAIHVYLPMGAEANIYPLIEWLLAEGKTVVCPKTLPNRILENRILTSLKNLENGVFGTRHPAEPHIYDKEIDLFIVPGLAFTKDGQRLGYGGGYYDTLLSKYPNALKWAVCYHHQILQQIPIEKHDVLMDRVFSA